MIGTIRKHQTWLWIFIVIATVASFVVLGPTNMRMGDIFGSHANYGNVSGHAITQADQKTAAREVALDTFFKTQQWPDMNSAEFNMRTYYRIFIIQKEKDMGIHVSAAAMAGFASRLLGQAPLDDFVDKMLKPMGMDVADFEGYLRHQLGLEQLMQAAGVNGKLVTPQEAETLYREEHQEVQADLVYFTGSNYLNSVTVTPAVVQQFYTNQIEHYYVPDMVQVDYVKFGVTNYFTNSLAALTNLDQIVDENVQRMGTNLFHNTKTPAESRAAVRYEIIRQHAIIEARKDANHFADVVDQMKPHTAASLEAAAKEKGLKVGITQPFERQFGPEEMVVPPDFARKAFALSPDEPFEGDIVADDGVYVIAFRQRIPAETPPLSKIEAKVTEDFRLSSAIQIAQQAALKFNEILTTNLDKGKSFTAICAENGVKYESLPPFSLSSRELPPEIQEKVPFSAIRQATFSTPVGKASQVDGARDGAFMIYVEKQLPVDEAKMKAELPAYIAYLRSARQNDAFNQWFITQIRQDPISMAIQQMTAQQQQGKSGSEGRPAS